MRKTDVTIAKNYLRENELKELNRIVNMWLDFAEDQALRRKQVFLQDWDTKLDQFLSFMTVKFCKVLVGLVRKMLTKKLKRYLMFCPKRRRLKEIQGVKVNIAVLKDLLKTSKKEK